MRELRLEEVFAGRSDAERVDLAVDAVLRSGEYEEFIRYYPTPAIGKCGTPLADVPLPDIAARFLNDLSALGKVMMTSACRVPWCRTGNNLILARANQRVRWFPDVPDVVAVLSALNKNDVPDVNTSHARHVLEFVEAT
jgi:hypothetical protein